MATRSKLTFLKLGHSSKARDVNRIVVMGAEDVGKTGEWHLKAFKFSFVYLNFHLKAFNFSFKYHGSKMLVT